MHTEYEIPQWLMGLEAKVRDLFEARKLSMSSPIGIGSGKWGQATGANGYSIWMSSGVPDVADDEPDNLGISVSVVHVNTCPEIDADVVWGHPSGVIEDEWCEERRKFSLQAVDELLVALPRLLDSFEKGLARGSPDA